MINKHDMKTKYTLLFVIIGAFALGITACHKDANIGHETPKVIETNLSVTPTNANFEWEVCFPGKVSSVVKLSRNADMSEAATFGNNTLSSDKTFSTNATELSPETIYYYCFEVLNPGLDYMSEVKSFTTMAPQKPKVNTASVSRFNFTQATAVGGGEVTDDGGNAVTECGIYYGANPNPATTGAKITATLAGTGGFTCTLSGLVEGITYYVCAYAANGQGISYGSERSFSYNPPPVGALNGTFSVSSSKQIYFSRGNLQYRASDGQWRFAENQWDFVGTQTPDQEGYFGGTVQDSDNSNISSTYENYIDLFGWGTSGWNSGAVCYQPWSSSISGSDYYPGGSYTNNLIGNYANADWGVYNAIYNGGNMSGQWRTLTKDELVYLFQDRIEASMRYGHGKVNGVCGMILLPDIWLLPLGLSFMPGNSDWINSYNTEQWAKMEANGAVFLPAAGVRVRTTPRDVGVLGQYWSASCSVMQQWCYGPDILTFYSGKLYPVTMGVAYVGSSVRLVTPAE